MPVARRRAPAPVQRAAPRARGDVGGPGGVDRASDRCLDLEPRPARCGLVGPNVVEEVGPDAGARGVGPPGPALSRVVGEVLQLVAGCSEAPYHFLKAAVAPMVERGEGQILVITSAAGARPTPGAPLYSAARAGATMLVRNVAYEIAATGVQVNAVGTNFMDFPEFLAASGATDPEVRRRIEAQVPMGRLGTMEEFSAFCMPFVDGTSRFTTGQFVAYAGGWA